MKKVIYTCITGEYDDVCAHVFVDDTWEYVMFTDNQYLLGMRRYMHWDIRPLEYKKQTNMKNARWHKINPHKLFPEYDYSLWIDGNIVVMKPEFFKRINCFIDNGARLVVPLHPVRTCIYDEAKTIKELKIDNKNTVNQEMFWLRLSRYPKTQGLNETCLMLRKHNDKKIRRIGKRWWRMVKNFSKRDQLAYNWAVWMQKEKTQPMFDFAGEHRNSDELLFVHKKSHNQNPSENFDNWVIPRWLTQAICIFITSSKGKQKFMKNHSR